MRIHSLLVVATLLSFANANPAIDSKQTPTAAPDLRSHLPSLDVRAPRNLRIVATIDEADSEDDEERAPNVSAIESLVTKSSDLVAKQAMLDRLEKSWVAQINAVIRAEKANEAVEAVKREEMNLAKMAATSDDFVTQAMINKLAASKIAKLSAAGKAEKAKKAAEETMLKEWHLAKTPVDDVFMKLKLDEAGDDLFKNSNLPQWIRYGDEVDDAAKAPTSSVISVLQLKYSDENLLGMLTTAKLYGISSTARLMAQQKTHDLLVKWAVQQKSISQVTKQLDDVGSGLKVSRNYINELVSRYKIMYNHIRKGYAPLMLRYNMYRGQ